MSRNTILRAFLLTFILILVGCTSQAPAEDTSADGAGSDEAVLEDKVAETEEETTEVVSDEEASEEATESNEDPVQYPITLEHAFGQTVIESKPERVATISWGNQDVPLALGVLPVGVSTANYGVLDGSGLLPWSKEGFETLGASEPVLFNDLTELDYEGINEAAPDVILAAYSGITAEEYELLSQIAPVIAYPTNPWQTYWRDQITLDAKGMGMEAEGQALVADLEALIAEKSSAYPQISGKSVAFTYFIPSDFGMFYVYLPSDPRAAYLTDLGMVTADSVAKLAEESTSFAIEISAENVDRLSDVDIIVTYGNDELLGLLQADPLMNTIPAIQRGSLVIIPDGTPLAASGTPSALSIPATIDEYLELIGEAADLVQ